MRNNGKIVLIGCGQVGNSFLYSAINQGLSNQYVLMDFFKDIAEGNALDLLDTQAGLPIPFSTIKASDDFNDCKDAEIIVITAGRPQKKGETRLEMVLDNAKIMKNIAENIKKSGFHGVTIIASNPVDILTNVYLKVTNFDKHKVIGSGTTLDTSRLRRLIAEKFDVSPKSVHAYLMGEHGDSSVAIWSSSSIMGKNFDTIISEGKITKKELDAIVKEAEQMAYTIINKKGSTSFGIGVYLTQIARAVLDDFNEILMVGCLLNGEYDQHDIVTGVPAIISKNGWERIIEWHLNEDEISKFDASCRVLKKSWDEVKDKI